MLTHSRAASALYVSLASLAIAALGACGGYSSPTEPTNKPPEPPGPPVAEATVQAIPSERFTPGNVTLTVGGTVTFAFGSLATQPARLTTFRTPARTSR